MGLDTRRILLGFAVFVILAFGSVIALVLSGFLEPDIPEPPPMRPPPEEKAAPAETPPKEDPEVTRGLAAGKQAEEESDWAAAVRAYRVVLGLDPLNADAKAGYERSLGAMPRRLPDGCGDGFMLPVAQRDMRGKPVVFRDELPSDPATGLSYEIWAREARMELVWIPAGVFDMGSPETETGRAKEEEPAHTVRIAKPFYLGKYEVTQAQWQIVMGSNPAHFPGGNRPVENVLWAECRDFLRRLNAGVLAGVPNLKFRLATEAEWEYACRAGTNTRYSFGADAEALGDFAWYRGNTGDEHHSRVGERAPNPWGLYDMHGNVWEWCEDPWHDDYRGAPADGAVWAGASGAHVMRGGSWDYEPVQLRCASRARGRDNYRSNNTGLRVVLEYSE